jgi:hypothetical protein
LRYQNRASLRRRRRPHGIDQAPASFRLARQFAQLEARLNKKLADHDQAIAAILSAIRELMNPPTPKRRGIGFTAKL